MSTPITGLHHVTSLGSDARRIDAFLAGTLGLRRVKKTVNFDAPEVYHLYYGDAAGRPGSLVTYFPFPNARPGRRGTGEVAATAFAVPADALGFWSERLAAAGADPRADDDPFGVPRLAFTGPDGDPFALVATEDEREPWAACGIDAGAAIRGLRSVTLHVADPGPLEALLSAMGYVRREAAGGHLRLARPGGVAHLIDLVAGPAAPAARQGAGSVHHVAFGVAGAAEQAALEDLLREMGLHPTPVVDRDYFQSIYFRAPGGILFEIATAGPGFARDEDPAHLGEGLCLPERHEPLRPRLERDLPPIG